LHLVTESTRRSYRDMNRKGAEYVCTLNVGYATLPHFRALSTEINEFFLGKDRNLQPGEPFKPIDNFSLS